MFIIDTSNKVPKQKFTIKEAYPSAYASIPDICLINTSNNDGILLNSLMLREALLNSKDFMYEFLGIVLEDKKVIEEQKKEEALRIKEDKEKAKEVKKAKSISRINTLTTSVEQVEVPNE